MSAMSLDDILKWQQETFPKATVLSTIEHLKRERQEYLDSKDPLEKADMALLLLNMGRLLDPEVVESMVLLFDETVLDAVDEKMKINVRRSWGEPDEYGVIEHVRMTTVGEAHPSPHCRVTVQRRDGESFVATPCYGMHEPFWVPLVDGIEREPVAMRNSDQWQPVRTR